MRPGVQRLPAYTQPMSIAIGSIVLRVVDLRRQAAFWAAALDYVPRDEPDDTSQMLCPRDGRGPNLNLDRRPSDAPIPPRIHLDLYAADQAAEVRRLIALGATEVPWPNRPRGADFVVLADPEGNRFCVIDKG